MVYSQNNEQEIILKFFNGFVGSLIDIGANDGKTFSNSKALIDIGWKAELYEPSPGAYKACKELHKENKKVKVHNYAISDSEKELIFYDCADSLLSSTDKRLAKSWGFPITEIKVKCVTYPAKNFDFVTIDAEGMDLVILKQIDLRSVKLLCIEHGNTLEGSIMQYCAKFGMNKVLLRNYENIILTHGL